MKRMLLSLLIAVTFTGYVHAAKDPLPQSSEQPIEITSLQLEVDRTQGRAIFTGQVVARQGDMTLYCDRLIVYSAVTEQKIERLEAFGHVRVVQLDRIATAEKAIYHQQQGTLELIGQAEVHQGKNQVAGEVVIVYLRENRSLAKGGDGGRVKALFFPEPKQEKP